MHATSVSESWAQGIPVRLSNVDGDGWKLVRHWSREARSENQEEIS